MTSTPSVIRLEPDGPDGIGLGRMDLSPDAFESGLPEQHVHVYFEDAARGISVGVWTTTDMQEAFGPYPGDEFMLLLEGRVLMTDGKGGEIPVETGQSFVLRNAIPVSWKQVGFLRKFFLIYLDPNAPTPTIESAEGGVVILDPQALASNLKPLSESIGGGKQSEAEAFINDTGNMQVGMWDSSAFESAMQPFSFDELTQVLEGAVTITQADGAVHRFVAGDVFFTPKDTVCSWKSDRHFRKYYVSLTEKA